MSLYIDGDGVSSSVSMAEVIDAVEKGLLAFSTGGVVQPVRSVLPIAEHGGYVDHNTALVILTSIAYSTNLFPLDFLV